MSRGAPPLLLFVVLSVCLRVAWVCFACPATTLLPATSCARSAGVQAASTYARATHAAHAVGCAAHHAWRYCSGIRPLYRTT